MAEPNNLVVGGATINIGGDLGYIKGPITQTPTIDMFTIDDIQQLPVDPEAWMTHRNFEISFTLLEPTQANIIIAWDLPDTASGTDPIALEIWDAAAFTFYPAERAIIATGVVPGADRFVRTVTYYKCVLTGPAPIIFAKGQETNLECTFKCLLDKTTAQVGLISDAAS